MTFIQQIFAAYLGGKHEDGSPMVRLPMLARRMAAFCPAPCCCPARAPGGMPHKLSRIHWP